MFSLQNISILLNSIPQMCTLPKYGIFQSSSFYSVKRIQELDIRSSELSQTMQLIKDLKCENILNYLANIRVDTGHRNLEWLYINELVNKLSRGHKRGGTSGSFNYSLEKKYRQPASAAPLNDLICNSVTINHQNSQKFSNQSESKNNIASPKQLKVSDKLNNFEESKKSLISQIMFFNDVSYKNVLRNGALYATLKLQLDRSKGNVGGQKRNFKTERQIKRELDQSPVGTLGWLINALLLRKGKHTLFLKGTNQAEDSQSFGKTHRLMLALNDLFRLLVWGSLVFLMYQFYKMGFMPDVFSNSNAPTKVSVTFDDAKGMDEAKAELKCVVEYLRDSSKFMYLGGKLPSGILLQGPPGTGKTLLARAVAGEANVNFFHISGSEFDEILVGEGARRVRKLFQTARQKAPAVIFIDEIDAIGGKRVSNSIHPFANQTIVQLLAEMDGFFNNDRIIVIGATNREFDLDEALLRPGRFDLKIQLHVPDIRGRKDILALHLEKVVHRNIDLDYFARRTVGFSGADLKNLVNQAALNAATKGCQYVETEHMEEAFEKITLGPALKSMFRTEQMNKVTAYHESGHATVAFFTLGAEPPIKASIIPHGRSLGHTSILPEEKLGYSKADLLASIDVKMGGRVAEELIFGPQNVTTGCQSDLDDATAIATKMVLKWGMSEKIGLRTHKKKYLGVLNVNEWGHSVGNDIDEEIKRIVQESYERAKKILTEHAREHKLLAERLLEKETLDADEIREILDQGRKNSGRDKMSK